MRTKWFAMVALILGLCMPGFGQTFGSITGEVKDASGAVIGGATLTLTNVETNANRVVTSNEAGIYSFPAIPPGKYTVKAERQGFKSTTRTEITVEVQSAVRVDIDMSVGNVTESVEVSAAGAVLTTENATVGTVIENKRIVELPLNGRNYLQLVALAPNVSFGFPSAGQAGSRQGGERAAQNISVAGQRNNYNHFTLDGVENTDPNFNTFVVRPSIDALQEFKVQSGVYPAEFGRGATQINVSTKSGTNEYHGALFHFLRNDKLDAANYAFTAARPAKDPFKWNQFGFTIGGPISIPKLLDGKNRLFFMSNYEWFRQRRQVQALYSLPATAMYTGDFSSLGVPIIDPASKATPVTPGGTPFAGNIIPANRIDATSKKLLEFYPTPNVSNLAVANNRNQAVGRPVNRDQFIQRIDWVESSKSNWFGRYSWGDENELNEQLRLNGTAVITTTKQWMASNTRVFTPTLVNEFRFGYTSFFNTAGTELAFTRDVVSELAIPGLAGGPSVQWGIPSVGFQGQYSGFGNDSEGPYANDNTSYQYIDNLSWLKGKHSFKFGGEVRRDNYNQVGNQFARGSFTFQRQATRNFDLPANASGDGFADFLLGQVYQPEAAVAIANANFRATSYAFYFDDVWKVSSKLTINYGIRYELTPPWEDQTGRLFNGIVVRDIDPSNPLAANVTDAALQPFFMRQGAASNDPYAGISLRWPNIAVRQDGSLGNRLVSTDTNDWAPRLGISWSPNSKWVIRTGAGMFYSQDTGNPRFDMARNLAGRLRDNAISRYLTWQNSLSSVAGGIANVPRPYTFANPYDRRTPYSMQYMLNVQRELAGGTLFEVGYLGSVSHRLESLRAVNEAVPVNPAVSSLQVFERSPFPQFGRIQLVDNGGNGNYNSLAGKLTKRYSNGMTYLLSYTWSKAIDTASAIRNQGGDTLFPQNSGCRQCERGRASFDVRQRLVTSVLYDIPVGKGRAMNIENGFANALIGGWQLGSIITLQTGFPVTVTNGQDASNTGAFFDRPNSTGVNADLPRGEQDPQRFFNTAAFVANAPGTYGNVGRNTLNSPGIISWDFSTLKDFNFNERHKLQFRFEAFNFPNHPNWGNPNTNVSGGTNFGRITGTRNNMRQLQFALKYIF